MAKPARPVRMEPNNNVEMIKNQLKELLKLEYVDQIYFVDERVGGYDVGTIIGLVQYAIQDGKDNEIRGIASGHFTLDQDIDILPNYLIREWDALSPDLQKNIFMQVAKISDETWLSDLEKVEQISMFFDNLQPLTPDQWVEQKYTIIEQVLPNRKIIVLFDEEFGDASPRKGHNFIEELKGDNLLTTVIPIIFSNKITTYASELEWRNNLATSEESILKKKDFFALSKSRSSELEAFADGIKKALLNNYIETIKIASLDVFDKALEETREEIENLDPYNFDDVILKSSSKEGIWEPFTLQRIIKIFQEDFIHQNMITSKYVNRMNKNIEIAKSISLIELPKPNAEPYIEKLKIRNKELYLSEQIINGLNYPLENGDIFKIEYFGEEEKNYVLVAQECDLMIRSDGKRNASIGLLLRIEIIDLTIMTEKQKKNTLKEAEQPNLYILRYYNEVSDSIGKVYFKDPLYVDIDFLDLTVFNSEGEAMISVDNISLPENEFGLSLQNRHNIIISKFGHIIHQNVKYQTVVQKADSRVIGRWIRRNVVTKDFTQIMQRNLLPVFSFPNRLDVLIKLTSSSIGIGVRRIKRLRYPDSKHLLDKFTRYQARNADLHDFAE